MRRSERSWLFLGFLGVLAAGCSGGSGDDDLGPDAGTGPDAGAASCLDPATADAVLPLGSLVGEASLGYRISANAERLFLGTLDAVYAIPAEGGEATPIHEAATSVPAHFLRSSDLIVLDGSSLLSLTFDGTPGDLPSIGPGQLAPDRTLEGTIDAVVDETHLYGRAKAYDPDTSILFRHALETGVQDQLGETAEEELFIGTAGSSVVTARKGTDGIVRLFQTPVDGGAAVELSTSQAFRQLASAGVLDGAVYLQASEAAPGSAVEARLYRIPVEDPASAVDLGAAGWVMPFAGQVDGARAGRGVVVRIVATIYFVEDGSSSAVEVAALCTEGYTIGASTAFGDHAYVSFTRDDDGAGGILQIPLP